MMGAYYPTAVFENQGRARKITSDGFSPWRDNSWTVKPQQIRLINSPAERIRNNQRYYGDSHSAPVKRGLIGLSTTQEFTVLLMLASAFFGLAILAALFL
jgi:hypothetical protein